MKLRNKPFGVGNLIEIAKNNKVATKNIAKYKMVLQGDTTCDLSKS